MKKLFLTAVVALSTLVASAQFMVVTTYDNDQEENMDKITANLGIGFMVNDAITIGMSKGSEHAHEGHDHAEDEEKRIMQEREKVLLAHHYQS